MIMKMASLLALPLASPIKIILDAIVRDELASPYALLL